MRVSTGTLVAAFCSAAILAACGAGNSGFSPQSAAAGSPSRPLTGNGYKIVYSFQSQGDGALPKGTTLIDVKGTLYGTTSIGGSHYSGCSGGCGAVFKVNRSGTESVLYSFAGGITDGASPRGGLIALNGTLYGTTERGGAYNGGTFFKITTTGTESMLYSFGHGKDAALPYATLVYVNGLFYGTTVYGGKSSSCTYGCGAVFSITPSGNEHVLHSFNGGTSDGDFLTGSLIYTSGKLYGTTQLGGTAACGCGVVFSVSTSGKEHVLYSFTGGADGGYPDAGLIDVNGTLYGMTGGSSVGLECPGSTCGTIFCVTPSGVEKTLYTFTGGTDGAGPFSTLIDVNGALYGTTNFGGGSNKCIASYYQGCGTVFKVSTSGNEQVLYSFKGTPDGWLPQTTLSNVKGTLYGTTTSGGSGSYTNCGAVGCGTVFKMQP